MAAKPKSKASSSKAFSSKASSSTTSSRAKSSGSSDDIAARRALAAALDAHLNERRRVSRVLHDDIGPALSAIGFQLDALGYDQPKLRPRTKELQSTLDEVMDRIRALSQELSISLVDRAGLQMALEELVTRCGAEFDGRITLSWRTAERLPGPVAMGFFDVAELALDNAVRHSAASRIRVTIGGKRNVTMDIRDNGQGFNSTRPARRGLGILRMHEASGRIGTTFSIDSVAGRGTIVQLRYAPERSSRR